MAITDINALQDEINKGLQTDEQTALQREAERKLVSQDIERSLMQAEQKIRSEAAQRGGLYSGGYLGAYGEAQGVAELNKTQRFADIEKTLQQTTEAKRQAAISQRLQLAGLKGTEEQALANRLMQIDEAEKNRTLTREEAALQRNEAEKARVFADQQRKAQETFSKYTQAAEQTFQKELSKLQQEFTTSERMSDQEYRNKEAELNRAYDERKLSLTQAWSSGERATTERFQAMQAEKEQALKRVMQEIELASQEGRELDRLAWEKEATGINNEFNQRMQQDRIDAEERMKQADMAYKQKLDGYMDDAGVYHPGLNEMQAERERIYKAEQAALDRATQEKLQSERIAMDQQIAVMQNETNRAQVAATVEAAQWQALGSVVGGIAGMFNFGF